MRRQDKKLCIFPSSKVPTSPRIEGFVEESIGGIDLSEIEGLEG